MLGRTEKILVHDAGVTSPPQLSREINDQGGPYYNTPLSPFAKHLQEKVIYTDNRFVDTAPARLNIADGDARPGTSL
jgi:hypothetical protein